MEHVLQQVTTEEILNELGRRLVGKTLCDDGRLRPEGCDEGKRPRSVDEAGSEQEARP